MPTHSPLRAGVIAAGLGERLQPAGPLKPLVPVAGRALIDRVLGSIAETGAAEVVVIINAQSPAIRDHVATGNWPFSVEWIVQTTPSSMHSFLLVLERLAAGHQEPVLISTVDVVTRPGAFVRFVAAARQRDADVTLALTTRIDDEKPLLVRLADDDRTEPRRRRRRALRVVTPRRIAAIGASAAGSTMATAGYYFVHPRVLKEADAARRDRVAALRAFFSRLVHGGYRLDGVLMPESIDVDRPADVAAAEQFLR